ncbi:MAG: SurA N-terminal domain-containing protein [Pseudorhodobacter sp.]
MAKQDGEEGRKARKGSSIIVWILMAMLVLGLGGFGVTNFGGGMSAVGTVGEREITVNDYARALQQEINGLSQQFGQQITMQQAQAMGLDRQVRQQLVNRSLLDNEDDRIGLSVGDARIAQEIANLDSFAGADGSFDREAYRFTLERNNLSEAEFESGMRDELARSLLQGAVASGFSAPPMLVDTLYAHISERRSFTFLRLTEDDLSETIKDPGDEQIEQHYQDHIDRFTRPEARRITYATLLPEDIADTMEVNEDALRRMYQERLEEFVQPERRLVERLVYPNDEAAAEARAQLDQGSSFEDLVAARDLRLEDIDLGDITQQDLGSAAGEAVFALSEPGIVGPVQSDLGPALFRMNAVLAAQETSFDEARETLADELETDAARRAIDAQIEPLDKMLIGGATLEDLVADSDMTLGQVDYYPGVENRMIGYPAFRKAAEEAETSGYPEIVRLEDGGIFALRLDEVLPAAPFPLEDIRDQVQEDWRKTRLAEGLIARATEIQDAIGGGLTLESFGLTETNPGIPRGAQLDALPATLPIALFEMAEDEIRLIDEEDFTALVRLDEIIPGESEGTTAEALKSAIAAQAEQALSQDALTLFVNGLTNTTRVQFDEAAINAVNAQFR